MRCVWLLAGLLVLTLGSGVVAQEAGPSYAPEDMTSALPSRIADIPLEVAAYDGDFAMELFGVEEMKGLLTPLGKGPGDVRMGYAYCDARFLNIVAVRVDGVDASSLVESFMLVYPLDGVSRLPSYVTTEWQELGGRTVLALARTDIEDEQVFYPKGEVIYLITRSPWVEATIEDVLAELP